MEVAAVGQIGRRLGFSANAKAEGALVFVGYGITAAELNYNDYAG